MSGGPGFTGGGAATAAALSGADARKRERRLEDASRRMAHAERKLKAAQETFDDQEELIWSQVGV